MAAWSYSWKGYGEIFDNLGSPAVHEVFRHIDPVFQRFRFNQPVLLIRAGNDESTTPDSTVHFYSKMAQNQKIYIRTIPNALHETDKRFFSGVMGFYVAQSYQNQNLTIDNQNPSVSWTLTNEEFENSIVVEMDRKPSRVTVFMAQSVVKNKRDFRMLRLNKDGFAPQKIMYM